MGKTSSTGSEKMETEIRNAPRKGLYEVQCREFKNFLSGLQYNY